MKSLQKTLHTILLATLSSHVFCCGIPTIVAVITLMSGLGFVAAHPWVDTVHDTMHSYEMVILGFSAVMLALGWALDFIARRVDCHDTGCCHGPCEPTKKRAHWILFVATALFIINVGMIVWENLG